MLIVFIFRRIVLISSYGSDTDSEAEEIKTPKKKITLFEEKKVRIVFSINFT